MKKPTMTLNAYDHNLVIAKIAEVLMAGVKIDLDELTIIPTATVAQCLGLSPSAVSRRFPITEIGTRTRGVALKTLREFIAKNTKRPRA